jgi:hypothetical protein
MIINQDSQAIRPAIAPCEASMEGVWIKLSCAAQLLNPVVLNTSPEIKKFKPVFTTDHLTNASKLK